MVQQTPVALTAAQSVIKPAGCTLHGWIIGYQDQSAALIFC